MPVRIENLSSNPVHVRCNSGRSIRLAPKTISSDILDVDVENNDQIQKLEQRQVIALHETKREKSPSVSSKSRAKTFHKGKG